MSQLALKHVLAALAQHPDDIDIQAKGLVVLGVLGQVPLLIHCHIKCCPAAVLPCEATANVVLSSLVCIKTVM